MRLRLPGFKKKSAYEDDKVVNPTHRSPLALGEIPGFHFLLDTRIEPIPGP
jgi:hypothetical protein